MPGYFAASATDRFLVALTRRPESRHFVFVLTFDRRLDEERLVAAWDETCRRHPILAAARWPAAGPAAWVPAGQCGQPPEPVGAIAIDTAGGRSLLRVSFDHGAVDVRAALSCLQTLRDRYRHRAVTRMPDAAPRTFGEVVKAAGLSGAVTAYAVRAATARWAALAPSQHAAVAAAAPAAGPEALRVRLGAGATARLRAAAAASGARVAAIVAAGLSLAWERAAGSDGARRDSGWLITLDLRPVLRVEGGAGNLSGIDAVSFPVSAANPLLTRAEAAVAFARLEGAYPGLASQVLAERWGPALLWPGADLGVRSGLFALSHLSRFNRVLSNLGPLPASVSDWGDAAVADFYVVPPLNGLRHVVFSVSSFAGELSIVVRQAGERLPGTFFERFGEEAPAALLAVAGEGS